MARQRMDYNLLSPSANSVESIRIDFNNLDEVSAKLFYKGILKAIKEAISHEEIDSLRNLSRILDGLKNYQQTDDIGHFNLVSLACKHKAITALEYIFSEENQTLYKLSINLTGVSKSELFSAKDEFCHDAFYHAIRSNKPDLLNFLVDKWQSQYKDEDLHDLLSNNYKELKLRNVSLTREMQFFFQSKIFDLRFSSTAGNRKTGNSWDQIEKRIKLVVSYAKYITDNYRDRDPDDKFIFIAEFIAKNIHVLKSLLKSTYDRFPWEEIEFCLIMFIRCCKNSSEQNLVYNCVLNKTQMLKHLSNFTDFLDGFKNTDVKKPNLTRDRAIAKIIKANSTFSELYEDYEKIRDFCSLEIIKSYVDLIKSGDATEATEKRNHFLVSRVLQVIGEHLKNTLYSPKLSSSTANVFLSSFSSNTRDILTGLRDSLSHMDTIFIRSDIEKKSYLLKNVQSDVSKMKAVIPDILNMMRIKSVENLIEKLKLCKSFKDNEKCYGPYRHSLLLHSKQIEISNPYISVKGDIERLKDLLLPFYKNVNSKSIMEEKLFKQIDIFIKKENERCENLKHIFLKKFRAVMGSHKFASSENYSEIMRKMMTATADMPLEAPFQNFKELGMLLDKLLKEVNSRILLKNETETELKYILRKIAVFLKIEMGSVKWIEEFSYIMHQNGNKKSGIEDLVRVQSDNLLKTKCSQLEKALINFNLNDCTSIKDFSSFESNQELQAVTEMLVLDILVIFKEKKKKDSCFWNPFFLDSDYPLLSGRNLRNHLAHGNALMHFCLEEKSALRSLLVYAKKLSTAFDIKNMDRLIRCDCDKLKSAIEQDLTIISNQQALFDALKNYSGNMEDVEKCVNEGADVYGMDCNSSTCLHSAAKVEDCAAVKWTLEQGLNANSTDTVGQTVLHTAAEFNSIEVMRYLVEQEKMSLDVCDANGKTPLHVAAENGSNDVVRYVLKHKQELITRSDKIGLSPLHTAINANKIDAVKIILEKEKNITANKSRNSYTLLHRATMIGSPDLVELFIEKKIKVDSESDSGETSLHCATFLGYLEIVKILVKKKANVNSKNNVGFTPLQNAASIGSKEIVEFLLQNGASVNVTNCQKITPLMMAALYGHSSVTELLLQEGAIVDSKDESGTTPLHYAALGGCRKTVEFLLNHKADIDCKNDNKHTALHLSAARGHKEVVLLLLKKGASINTTDSTKCTPLHLSLVGRHKHIAHILINKNAKIDCKDENEMTALHMAAMNKDRGVVKSLLKKGADIRSPNAEKNTPLCFIIARGLSDLIPSEEKDVYWSDDHGFTLLHQAASAGDEKLVEYCIEHNCNINAPSKSGVTALHLAVVGKNLDIVKILLKKGAEINKKDNSGCTPLLLAAENNCAEILKILVKHDGNRPQSLSDDKIVALRQSVGIGYGDIVGILLEKYKSNITNEFKREMLFFAVYHRKKHVVTTLLDNGSDINGGANPKPLHIAVARRHYDIVELLLKKGADPNMQEEHNYTALDIAVLLKDADMLEILLTQSLHIKIESKSIISAAERAVNINQLNIIKLFLQMKVIETAELMLIAVREGKANVCEILLERNADPNASINGEKLLINLALEKGHKEVVSVLIHYGAYYNANPALRNLTQYTTDNEAAFLLRNVNSLFNYVEKRSECDVENLLVKCNSKYCLANAKCRKLETVLHYASWKGYKEIVDILLNYNANPNTRTKKGLTPLHYAAEFSHFGIVESLLSNGAIYNALSQTGKTLSEYASDEQISDLLLFLNNIFTKVQGENLSVLDDLKGKDGGLLRAAIRTKNRDGKTLTELARISNFPKMDELQKLFNKAICEDFTLAETLVSENKLVEASLKFENLLREAIFDPDSQRALDVKYRLAEIYRNQGNLDKALHIFREVHQGRNNSLGKDHVKTLLVGNDIATLSSQQGKEALKIKEPELNFVDSFMEDFENAAANAVQHHSKLILECSIPRMDAAANAVQHQSKLILECSISHMGNVKEAVIVINQ
ncbi:unnamed protein product [Larinioides sclopetarius]|uniref:Alpha-latrotoxin n=1 Tax=Larinioides sclopetarius TaxID=280406 RepID=A0AAV2ANS8_9ARAC